MLQVKFAPLPFTSVGQQGLLPSNSSWLDLFWEVSANAVTQHKNWVQREIIVFSLCTLRETWTPIFLLYKSLFPLHLPEGENHSGNITAIFITWHQVCLLKTHACVRTHTHTKVDTRKHAPSSGLKAHSTHTHSNVKPTAGCGVYNLTTNCKWRKKHIRGSD